MLNQKMKLKMKIKIVLLITVILALAYSVNAQKRSYDKTGIASFYANKFEGRTTANGEIYYHAKKTAAHRSLPFGSIVKVTNIENNKQVVVRINDRGPFIDNRIIDLSKSAAQDLGFVDKGLSKVRVELIASTNDLPDTKINTHKKETKNIYYKINSELVKPKEKGVQIGSYTDDENVIKLIAELKSKYNENIYVEIAEVKKQKVYRIILGNYNSGAQLNALKKKLSKVYPDCFIVEYK